MVMTLKNEFCILVLEHFYVPNMLCICKNMLLGSYLVTLRAHEPLVLTLSTPARNT